MLLGHMELQSFLEEVLNKIQLEIIRGNANNELEKVLDKYNLNDILKDIIPSCDFYLANTRRTKILVIAISLPNVNDWKMRAKKRFKIPSDRIEFVTVKPNFDYGHLINTSAYSDIIVGPIHHKGVGINDNSSFLAAVEKNPELFPKVHRMIDSNGTLILSQSAFERCLENTNFIKECID